MNKTARRGVILVSIVLLLAQFVVAGDVTGTAHREVSKPREVSDLAVRDFFDNMECGSLLGLRTLGPGAIELGVTRQARPRKVL